MMVEVEMNVPRIRHSEMSAILDVHFAKKVPAMFLGYAGTGKSVHIREWAQRKATNLGLRFVERPQEHIAGETFLFLDLRASQLEPQDVRGLPFPADGRVEWKLPEFLPSGGDGVIFLDELNHAPPSVLHALYQLILDRKVGENYSLPQGFVVLAAGNVAGEDEYLSEMPPPLRNRMSIYMLAMPTVEEWTRWAAQNGIDGRIIAFLQRFPQYMHTFAAEREDQTVFATPRAWERVATKIQGVDSADMIYTLTAADVGQEVAATFRRFVEETVNAPKPEEIIENPAVLESVEPHIAVVYGGAAVEWWRQGKKENTAKIVDALLTYRPDAGIVTVRMLHSVENGVVGYLAMKMSSTAYERLASVEMFARELRKE